MIRTPKKQSQEPSPPLSTPPKMEKKSVRQSLEKREAALAGPSISSAHLTQAAPAAQRQILFEGYKSPRKVEVRPPVTFEVRPPVTGKCKDRMKEAEAWIAKARTSLDLSRNLKKEYKDSISGALDRLRELLAASEEALRSGRARKGPGDSGDVESLAKHVNSTFTVAPDPDLSGKLEEHSRLLTENSKRLTDLQEQLAKYHENLEQRSYANVVASKPPQQLQGTIHSVIVTSKDETETGEEILNKVRRTIDAKEGWVKIEKVRKARDRKVIMGFHSEEERRKAKERLTGEGTGLDVEEVKNRDPLLVLKGVLSMNTDDDIVKALRNQNRELFANLNSGDDRILVKYRKQTRNPHTNNVVLSSSPILWSRIIGMGSVHIDLQRVRAEDQSPLVQCSRCLGYGHSRKFCKESVDGCSHCGGPHLKAKCDEWAVAAPPTCINCSRAKLENREHNAFSSDCPIRRRWDELARSTVAYC